MTSRPTARTPRPSVRESSPTPSSGAWAGGWRRSARPPAVLHANEVGVPDRLFARGARWRARPPRRHGRPRRGWHARAWRRCGADASRLRDRGRRLAGGRRGIQRRVHDPDLREGRHGHRGRRRRARRGVSRHPPRDNDRAGRLRRPRHPRRDRDGSAGARLMPERTIRVAVSGSTGQVAYALLPRIAAGEMFGRETPVDLRLYDIPPVIAKAKGTVMELEDCAYPLLSRVSATAERGEAYRDADWVLLVGSKPRGPGMERKDLIRENGPIFVEDGKAIAANASRDVRVVVVGNPCNTNCLIALSNAKGVPSERFTAMTRLDQNRARMQLALKAAAPVKDVTRCVIWGNHSSTLFPDFVNARVGGKKATDVVDRTWLENEFVPLVQKRGAAVIEARGASSAF